jgi:hypothetical protein
MSLLLTGQRQGVREICNNGIDDNGDGATDCADSTCVASAVCAQFVCRPDQNLGLLQLSGGPATAAVTTAMGGDDQKQAACTSATGGQDGVVDFRLPARADLTLEWAQVGDHDFALYSDQGALFACDAGATVACVPTMGLTAGSHIFTGLPPGRYHLVIDADRPGKEGGVIVQLSAVASIAP